MSLIEWSEELSVGDETIDNQHMVLVRAINLLADGVDKSADEETMEKIFEILTEYTATHFVYEEDRFKRGGYPASDEHIKEHEELLYKVVELKMKWEQGEAEISPAVLDFLQDWLKQHIIGSDKKYASYLAN